MIITNLILASYCSSLYNEIVYRRNPTGEESIKCESQFNYLSRVEIKRQQVLIRERLGQDYFN